jgi:hypothetical protein
VALVTNFEDRIKDLAGVPITADTNALEQFVVDGCYDVIDKLKQTGDFEVHNFVTASLAEEDGSGLDTDEIRNIEYVERNGFPCRKVPETQRQYLDNANSIYKATADDPVYYIFNGTAHVKPEPSGSEPAYFYYIRPFTITSFNSSTSSINGFPDEYYEHIILYAAHMALGRQLLNLIQDTTDASISMDVISKLMNDNKPNSGQDVWDYLVDEDSEMAQATMAAIQSASAINKQKYDYYKDRMMALKAEYMGKFNFQAAGGQG